jgi:hypothetical protein
VLGGAPFEARNRGRLDRSARIAQGRRFSGLRGNTWAAIRARDGATSSATSRLPAAQELFGEEGLRQIYGKIAAARIEAQVRRVAGVLLPLQDRSSRMLDRSLDALPRPTSKSAKRRRRQMRATDGVICAEDYAMESAALPPYCGRGVFFRGDACAPP